MAFLSSSHWLRLLRFCAKCDFYLKPPTNNFQSTKFLIHMRWDIEEGCLGQTIRWNAVMASSNRGNSCCYYWLARSNGRTCTVIVVIYLESLVWFAFWLLKCSLKHHYVSFWSYYFYIIFFFFFQMAYCSNCGNCYQMNKSIQGVQRFAIQDLMISKYLVPRILKPRVGSSCRFFLGLFAFVAKCQLGKSFLCDVMHLSTHWKGVWHGSSMKLRQLIMKLKIGKWFVCALEASWI